MKETLETTGGDVHLCYFDNLAWTGRGSRSETSPVRSMLPGLRLLSAVPREFDGGADGEPERQRPRDLRALGTLSSGYDSSTAAVLAHGAGCSEVLSFDRASGGHDDRGTGVAAALGLTAHVVERAAWRRRPFAEVPFIAVNARGEDVQYTAAEHLLGGRVLFTGYHGDKAWAKDTKALGTDIVRGDMSGLSLSEFRLWAGFLNCPIPFWGVRQVEQIHAISNAAEMRSWDVPGDDSRPICRRIVEEAGVEREAFGHVKRAATTMPWGHPQGRHSAASRGKTMPRGSARTPLPALAGGR